MTDSGGARGSDGDHHGITDRRGAVFHGEIEELLADQNAFAWPGILFGKSALELEKRLPLTTQSFPGRSKRFPACRRRIRESRWMRPAPAIPQRTAIRLSRRITERRSMRQR